MDNLATTVINKYLTEDFMPETNQAISNALAHKKVSRIMPKVLTDKVMKTILEPTIKNSDKPTS